MDYSVLYKKIIDKAKKENNKEGEYYEKHHILPKCMGGTNDKENIVKLTLKQHFLCHKILLLLYPNARQLQNALFLMCNSTIDAEKKFLEKKFEIKKDNSGYKNPRISFFLKNLNTRINISSREYDFFRKEYILYQTGKKRTKEQCERISLATKKAMYEKERILKRRKGVLNTKHYYNKKTRECYKWFPGDADIDLTIFSWGRPPMSEEQRNKLKDLQKDVKPIYNSFLEAKSNIHLNLVNKDYLPDGWVLNPSIEMTKYTNMKNIIRPFLKDVHFEMAKRSIFIDDVFYYKKYSLSLYLIHYIKKELRDFIDNKKTKEESINLIIDKILLYKDKIKEMNLKFYKI